MAKKQSGYIVDLGGVPKHCDIEELSNISVPLFDEVTQKKMGKMPLGDLFAKFR